MDVAILEFFRDFLHNDFTRFFFPLVSCLGNAGLIWLAAAVVLLCVRRWRRVGVLLLAALAITFLLNDIVLKNIVERPRPFVDHPELIPPIRLPSGFSFPSGHSASSFAAAAVLLFCGKRWWGIAAVILAALIAFSRAFLFVHYPSDVLIGSLLGFAVGTACVFLARRFFPSETPLGVWKMGKNKKQE